MPKESLKDKLDGDELDLGLNNLSTVPVKELSLLPKARRLDLSCNTITTLPDAFCDLTHLVKIDFSKNQLTELPVRFGALSNLEHLDLLGNQLTILPISFCHLNKLKWLDLKDNPLKEDLKKAAGDCLDEKQCKTCAKNVITYMKHINSELERRKQKELQKKREEEEKIKAIEEAAKEKVRQERKLKRQRQRQEAESSLKAKDEAKEMNNHKDDNNKPNGVAKSGNQQKKEKTSSGFGRFFYKLTVVTAILALLFAVIIGLVDYCETVEHDCCCEHYYEPVMKITGLRPTLRTTRDHVFVLYNAARTHVMAFLGDSKDSSAKGTSPGSESGKT